MSYQNRMYLRLSVINNNKICIVYRGTEVQFALHILLFMIVPCFMCVLGIGQQWWWLWRWWWWRWRQQQHNKNSSKYNNSTNQQLVMTPVLSKWHIYMKLYHHQCLLYSTNFQLIWFTGRSGTSIYPCYKTVFTV